MNRDKNKRRLKSNIKIMEEAMERNMSLGGLARAIYGRPPLERSTRIKTSMLRYKLRCKLQNKKYINNI